MAERNLLVRVKDKVPLLFGIGVAVFYLVLLNVSVLGVAFLGGEHVVKDVYLLQFIGTAVASLFMLFIVWGIGYGGIFWARGRGIWYCIGTGGYLLTVAGIALASSMGMYLLTEEHEFRQIQPVLQILIFILSMAGIGFAEELAFRGILMNLLREKFSVRTDKGIWLVLVIQGVIFGGCHIVNALSGAKLEGVIVQAVMASLLGILLGAIYLRTGSFWFVVFLHGFNDFCALSVSGIYGIDSITDTISSYSWINLVGAPVYVLVIAILLRRSKRQEIKGEMIRELPLGWRVVKGVVLTGISLFMILLVFVSYLYLTWTGMA